MAKWAADQKRRHKDKARRKSYRARFPLRELIRFCKSRAKKSRTPIDIEEADFDHLPTHCPILGVPLRYGGNGKGRQDDNSATIDRIDNSKGYVKGNVLIVSWRANRLKNDANAEELLRLGRFYQRDSTSDGLLYFTTFIPEAPILLKGRGDDE